MTQTQEAAGQPKKAIRREMNATLQDRLVAGLFYGFIGFFKMLGPRRASNLGSWLFKMIGPRTKVQKLGHANLTIAFPEKSEAEREEILTGVWETLGRTTAEYPFLRRFTETNSVTKVEITGEERVREVLAEGNGAILLTGHFANWELLLTAARLADVEGSAVYRPANNPFINDWILAQREAITPLTFLGKQMEGPRALMNSLRKGNVLCFLADQKLNEGVPVPFFGRDAMTTPAPARLSLKFRAPLIPIWGERVAPLHYKVHADEPIPFLDSGDPKADLAHLLKKSNEFYEEALRRHPDQWLWLHDRWSALKKAKRVNE
jgi:KDO2-lipid IV(A) lauroyltransferase